VDRGKLLTLVVAAVASVVVVAGCGGSDDGSEARLTKAELIAQGDKICQEADGRRLAALAPYIKEAKEDGKLPPEAEQKKLVVELVLPPFREEAEELAELNPPQRDEKEIEAIVAEIEAAVKRGEENPQSILAGAETQFGKAEQLGREYGFKHCGRS
jgi:hypothetical protein